VHCFHWFFIFAAFVFVFMSSSIVMVLIILDVSFELRAPSEHTVCVHVPVPLIQQVADSDSHLGKQTVIKTSGLTMVVGLE